MKKGLCLLLTGAFILFSPVDTLGNSQYLFSNNQNFSKKSKAYEDSLMKRIEVESGIEINGDVSKEDLISMSNSNYILRLVAKYHFSFFQKQKEII